MVTMTSRDDPLAALRRQLDADADAEFTGATRHLLNADRKATSPLADALAARDEYETRHNEWARARLANRKAFEMRRTMERRQARGGVGMHSLLLARVGSPVPYIR